MTYVSEFNQQDIARLRGQPATLGKPAISMAIIQAVVAEYYGFSREALISRRRNSEIAVARQVAIYLCRVLTRRSFTEIARRFEREHSSALKSYRLISRLRSHGRAMDDTLRAVLAVLQARGHDDVSRGLPPLS